MSLLDRDSILKAEDLERRTIPVAEWGGDVLVRALTGAERDDYEASMMRDRGKDGMVRDLANARAKLVARCCIDEDGRRLFSDQDIGALGEKSAAALDRVFTAAAELSRLSDEDVEELAGNSAAAQNEGSISSSLSGSAAPSGNF